MILGSSYRRSLIAIYLLAAPIGGSAHAQSGDRAILTALYHSTGGDHWKNGHGWLTDAPLDQWYGVEADDNDRVTLLRLDDNGLAGQLPPELGDLTSLRELRFIDNPSLSGPIPDSLGNLDNLETLFLSRNDLSGPIPHTLGRLTNLDFLSLTRNGLSGPIPPELGRLRRLRALHLGGNDLAGLIPPALGDLVNLERLSLGGITSGGNALSGPIPPDLGRLTNLRVLSLIDNQLSEPIPGTLGELANLQELYLFGNRLSGSIPAALGNLVNLRQLQLHHNNLSGEVPSTLGNLANLEWLLLNNNILTDHVPRSWTALSRLTILDLSRNAGLCVPRDPEFDAWLATIEAVGADRCDDERDVPGVPWELVLTAGPWRIEALWSPPITEGRSPVTDYDVRYAPWGGPWVEHPHSGTVLSATITELEAGREYEVQVRAANEIGPGPWASDTATPHQAGFEPFLRVVPNVIRGGAVPTRIVVEVSGFPTKSDFPTYRREVNFRLEGGYQIQDRPDAEPYSRSCSGTGADTTFRELSLALDDNGEGYAEFDVLVSGDAEEDIICEFVAAWGGEEDEVPRVSTHVDFAIVPEQPTLDVWESHMLADGQSLHVLNVRASGDVDGGPRVELSQQRSHPLCGLSGSTTTILPGPPDPGSNLWHQWSQVIANRITLEQLPPDVDSVECVFSTFRLSAAYDTVVFRAVDAPSAKPDLVVESVSVSDDTLSPNQLFTLRTTVRNDGAAPAAATILYYYLGNDTQVQVGTDLVEALLSGGVSEESVDLTAPSDPGTYHYSAYVDPVSGESSVDNNWSATVAVSVDDGTGESDRSVLMSLYEATDGTDWTNRTNWGSDLPLDQWYGVEVDLAGHVTHLRLQDNGLAGTIPRELALLEVLTELWLNDNELTGTIPSELGGLAHLRHISLDTNWRLEGPVPASFANLRTLWTLRLEETGLSGPLPQGFVDLRSLRHLSMGQTSLCVPDNEAFRAWVRSLAFFSGRFCGAVPALPPGAVVLLGMLVGLAGVARLVARERGTAS